MTLRELLATATPGPWTADIRAWGDGSEYCSRIDLGGQDYVETFSGHYGPSPANARLIALAPEMGRLLLDMADALRDTLDYEISDLSDSAWNWHGMHNHNGEQEADDCIVCTFEALLARLDRIGQ